MLTLFHAPASPSSRMVWLLEELQAEYQLEIVSYPKSDGSNADPKNPHPHGYTPALVHDGMLVTESGAITLYLTDLFPDSLIGIPASSPLRGRYLTWLFYQVGLAEPLLYMKAKKMLQTDAAMAHLFEAMLCSIEETLADSTYLLGERFTAADILYMSLFESFRGLLGERDWIKAYIARGFGRPARKRAQLMGG
jgi:glutathione S-transferase